MHHRKRTETGSDTYDSRIQARENALTTMLSKKILPDLAKMVIAYIKEPSGYQIIRRSAVEDCLFLLGFQRICHKVPPQKQPHYDGKYIPVYRQSIPVESFGMNIVMEIKEDMIYCNNVMMDFINNRGKITLIMKLNKSLVEYLRQMSKNIEYPFKLSTIDI